MGEKTEFEPGDKAPNDGELHGSWGKKLCHGNSEPKAGNVAKR